MSIQRKTVAVLQSNYIPWKGYFDIIRDVDEFIFYDDVQYTKNDWRNRNVIKTAKGTEWLTIPVGADIHRLICEVRVSDERWRERHWAMLQQHYRQAPYFGQYRAFWEGFYQSKWESLSEMNQYLIRTISQEMLGISTRFTDSRAYGPAGAKLERLLDLLRKAGATRYISGPAARSYIDPNRFAEAGIELIYKDYSGYPEYPQFHPPFVHGVTVLDLLFHTGRKAPWHIWGWREHG